MTFFVYLLLLLLFQLWSNHHLVCVYWSIYTQFFINKLNFSLCIFFMQCSSGRLQMMSTVLFMAPKNSPKNSFRRLQIFRLNLNELKERINLNDSSRVHVISKNSHWCYFCLSLSAVICCIRFFRQITFVCRVCATTDF